MAQLAAIRIQAQKLEVSLDGRLIKCLREFGNLRPIRLRKNTVPGRMAVTTCFLHFETRSQWERRIPEDCWDGGCKQIAPDLDDRLVGLTK